MRESKTRQQDIPVVRLMLALPFLDAARHAGADVDDLLLSFGLNALAFDNADIFVPAPTMYDIVETLAEATGDPFIGAKLGLQLNVFEWPPLISAARHSNSVGDFLLRFCIDAFQDASSVVFKLQTMGARTTFQEIRVSDGGRTPRHNDAFGVGYVMHIINSAVGKNWEGRQVIASVCDPSAIPEDFCGIRMSTTDTKGFSISFPCEWLLLQPALKMSEASGKISIKNQSAPDSILGVLHHVLELNLANPDLDSALVARFCGLSQRTLTRKLANIKTTLGKELVYLRRKRSEEYLAGSELKIREIGLKVGYNDPAVFTRAFRRWTDMTPTKYRSSS